MVECKVGIRGVRRTKSGLVSTLHGYCADDKTTDIRIYFYRYSLLRLVHGHSSQGLYNMSVFNQFAWESDVDTIEKQR